MRFLIILAFFSSIGVLKAQTDEVSDENRVYFSLETAARNPDKVYNLDLSKNKISAFPIVIFSFYNLRKLNLSNNRITAIPDSIFKLQNLEELDLSKNKLTEVPPTIGKLKNLKVLMLYKNEIDTLPGQFGDLENLERLDLWENEIHGLPDSMRKLKNLKVLEMRGILFNDKQQEHFRELMPNTLIYMSPGCNTCKE